MSNLYNNDKSQTAELRKILQPHTQNKIIGEIPKDRKGTAGAPANRTLPIRSR